MADDSDPGTLDDFQDFTTATPWEGIAASIENAFHSWTAAGWTNGLSAKESGRLGELQTVLEHNLPHRSGVYLLTLHLPPPSRSTALASKQQRQQVDSGRAHPYLSVPTVTAADASDGIELRGRGNAEQSSGELDAAETPPEVHEAESMSDRSKQTAANLSSDVWASAQLAHVRTGQDQVAEGEGMSASTTPASAFTDAHSRSATESMFMPHVAAPSSSDNEADADRDLEDSPPLFPRKAGKHSPTPSMEDLESPAAEERARRFAVEDCAKLRTWFAVQAFVTLAPDSYSGRIMDAQEANVLVSALAVASASSRFPLACFVPVHDGLRDAYWGIGRAADITTRHYEADSVHISNPPARLLQADGQVALFAERLRAQAPRAAALCSQAAQTMWSTDADQDLGPGLRIHLRRTFRVLRPRQSQGGSEKGSDEDDDVAIWRDQWDAGCAWWPWASQTDPCVDLEVDLEWLGLTAAQAADASCLSAERATRWRLHVLTQQPTSWSYRPAFLLQASVGSERPLAPRRHLQLELPGSQLGGDAAAVETPKNGSLAAMLASLWEGKATAAQSGTIGQLASSEWWGRRGSTFPTVPSEVTLQDVLRDLFGAVSLPAAFASRQSQEHLGMAPELGTDPDPWSFSNGLPKCAPAACLAARLSLHALTFSNPRAVATLWYRFVRELRFAYWELRTPLPRMAGADSCQPEGSTHSSQGRTSEQSNGPPLPDLGCGLLHQKLQMLNVCIHRQRSRESSSGIAHPQAAVSRGFLEGLNLLGGDRAAMREPTTQPPPVLTEDMLQEREAALSALGETPGGQSGRARLQGDLLASDMSAFKAANPGALLEDFVRWHSPRDWEVDASLALGGRLSPRIGGIWLELWESAQPVPAERQKPLMDPQLEGERVLHWFENTVLPEALWSQLLPVALSTAAACLAACRCTGLPVLAEAFERFRSSASAALDRGLPLEDTFTPLLTAFQRLECLTVAAESLLLRLPDAPHLVSRALNAALGSSPPPQPLQSAGERSTTQAAGAGSDSLQSRDHCRAREPGLQSLPFCDPDGGEGGVDIEGGREKQVMQGLMSSTALPGSAGTLSALAAASGEFGPVMQSEWLIEVETLQRTLDVHRMYTAVRPGELRIATSIVAEM